MKLHRHSEEARALTVLLRLARKDPEYDHVFIEEDPDGNEIALCIVTIDPAMIRKLHKCAQEGAL